MFPEGKNIKVGEGDAPGYINIVNLMMESLIFRHTVKEVVYVKIKNWFDHKWLNYSGKTVIPFEYGNTEALESVWRDKISIPPFNPNWVISSKFFVMEDSDNPKLGYSIHKRRISNDNIHNRIEHYSPDGLVLWYSSNSESLQKGSLMVYRVQEKEVYTWYATIENKNGWGITKAKGLPLSELRAYLP